MIKFYPDIYSIRLWYAKTLENNNSAELYEQLDKAIKIAPARAEAFKTGLKIAFKNRLEDKKKTSRNN